MLSRVIAKNIGDVFWDTVYFVVRVGCRRETVHVRYLISWWASCMHLNLMSWKQLMEYWTLWIVQLLWRALRFWVSIFVKDNDNGDFHYNPADAKARTYKINTTCYTKLQRCELAPGNCRASNQLFHGICFCVQHFKSCIFMSCIFMPRDFDGPSFSRSAFSIAPKFLSAVVTAADCCCWWSQCVEW